MDPSRQAISDPVLALAGFFAVVVLPREGIGLMQGWRGLLHEPHHDEGS